MFKGALRDFQSLMVPYNIPIKQSYWGKIANYHFKAFSYSTIKRTLCASERLQSRRPNAASPTTTTGCNLPASHGTLPPALPPAPPWAVAHPRLPVWHSPTHPRACPPTLPRLQGPSEPAVAKRGNTRRKALGHQTTTYTDNRLHLQHKPGDLRRRAEERQRRKKKRVVSLPSMPKVRGSNPVRCGFLCASQ